MHPSNSAILQIESTIKHIAQEVKGYVGSFINGLDCISIAQHIEKFWDPQKISAQMTIMLKVIDGIFTHMGAKGVNDLLFTTDTAMFMVNVLFGKAYYLIIVAEKNEGSQSDLRSAGMRYSRMINSILEEEETRTRTHSSKLQAILDTFIRKVGVGFLATDIVGLNGQSIAGEVGTPDFDRIYASACGALSTRIMMNISSFLDAGDLVDSLMTSDKFALMTINLANEYYWGVATTLNADYDSIRVLMKECAPLIKQVIIPESKIKREPPSNAMDAPRS